VDSQTDPVAARNGATTLIQQNGVQAIVGGVSSSEALAAAPVAEAAGVVLISPTATVAAISTSDSNDSVWRTTASDRLQGKAAALLSYNNLSYRRISILAANNAYGNALATSFLENFTVLGGTIPILVYYAPNQGDYSSDLTVLFSTNPEAVYLVAYPYEGTIILNNWWSNHAAWPTHWILTDGMEDQTTMDQLRSGGVNTTGLIGLSPTRSPTATGINAYERFRSAFAARFGSDPVILSENAYDSAFVLALAMHASGSTNPELFRRAIRYVANPPGMMILPGQWAQAVAALDAGQDIDYWGAANRVEFDSYGDTGTAYFRLAGERERYDRGCRRPRRAPLLDSCAGRLAPNRGARPIADPRFVPLGTRHDLGDGLRHQRARCGAGPSRRGDLGERDGHIELELRMEHDRPRGRTA